MMTRIVSWFRKPPGPWVYESHAHYGVSHDCNVYAVTYVRGEEARLAMVSLYAGRSTKLDAVLITYFRANAPAMDASP